MERVETGKTHLLFVYGTLMSGYSGDCALLLRQHARLVGEAYTYGQLWKITWYPGLTVGGSSKVWGELYELLHPADLWPALDNYEGVDSLSLEGEEYFRKVIAVYADGEPLRAWTYVYTGTQTGEVIISGRFKPNLNGASGKVLFVREDL